MDGPSVNRFLKWVNKHAKYVLLVEPTHERNFDSEEFLDIHQQMINRHKEAYTAKFKELNLEVLHIEQFNCS